MGWMMGLSGKESGKRKGVVGLIDAYELNCMSSLD
jgi:hypothetical protein